MSGKIRETLKFDFFMMVLILSLNPIPSMQILKCSRIFGHKVREVRVVAGAFQSVREGALVRIFLFTSLGLILGFSVRA